MQKICFETHGCASNQSESEVMAGILDKAGYSIVDDAGEADLVVVNTCTVKGEGTAAKAIRKLKTEFPEKKMVIAGCVTPSLIPMIREYAADASVINTHNLPRILEVVEETLQGNTVEFLKQENIKKINFPRIRKNPVVGIVPILVGCANFCTFCSTKLIKNKLYSYSIEDITDEIRTALKQGCKEIWLTSEDNGAYMMEKGKGSKLPELLREVSGIPGDFKIRLGMMNPGNLIPVLDELISVFKNEKFFKFIHVPLQAGNDEILKKMNRQYTVDDFFKVIDAFRKEISEIAVSTDIIVAFPTETEEQFNDSLEAMKRLRPDVLNISRFQARKGTLAEKVPQVLGKDSKGRSTAMTYAFMEVVQEKNTAWIGWEGEVLLDDTLKKGTMQGRNFAYRPIVVDGTFELGSKVKVKITSATPFDIRGEVVKELTCEQ